MHALPNDPRFGEQYGLNNTGQTGGVAGADIDAAQAWDLTTGDSSVIVAVLDSGMDYNHPDLAHALWTNPAEVAGNGVDDDHNGHVDDTRGWDFAANDNDPMDVFGHGTHVTGILAAKGDNAVGVAGMAWGVKVLPVRFLDDTGNGTVARAISSVNYVTTLANQGHNIRVLNASWGEYAHSVTLYNALAAQAQAGVLVVAAAGNHGRDIDNDALAYRPAAFDLPNILSVAATDHSDHLAGFSNYGQSRVDIAAPGDAILSTQKNNSYGTMFGTSMAAPLVSGLAALAFSISPEGTPYTVVRDAILAGGDAIAALATKSVTGRRVNAYQTLLRLPLAVLSTTPAADQPVQTAPADFTVRFSHAIDGSSLSAGDFLVNGTTADAVTITDARTALFHFDASPVDPSRSLQAMSMAAGSLSRDADSGPLAAFSSAFRYDPVAMQVVSTVPAGGASPPLASLDITFNEPVDPATIGQQDLTLSRGAVSSVEHLGPTRVRFLLTGLDAEGPVEWSLPAGVLSDAAGNPNPGFSGWLDLDIGINPLPAAFTPLAPAGSLIQRSAFGGLFNAAGDSDSYTLQLTGGQTLSARLSTGTLSVRDPDGQLIAGPSALLQSAPILASGTYTLTASGGAAGAYSVDVLLNASFESESFLPGVSNDTPPTAQPLGAGVVAAVLGRTERPPGFLPTEVEPNDATSNSAASNFQATTASLFHLTARGALTDAEDDDYYSLGHLDAGDVLTASLSGVGSGRGTIEDAYLQLYRGSPESPVIVDDDDDGGPGRDALLYRFPVAVADTYYLRVRQFPDEENPPAGGTYELSVYLENENPATTPPTGPGLTADSASDDTLGTASDLSSRWGRINRLSSTGGVISSTADHDLFAYSLSAGDIVSVHVAGDGDVETQFVLRDGAGNVIASDDGLGATDDANSAAYGLVVPVTGTYVLDIFSQTGVGDYTAVVSLFSANPPPLAPSQVTDVYSLAPGQPGRVTFTPFSEAEAEILLLDSEGGLIDSITGSGPLNIPASLNVAYISVTAAADLDYTLVVAREVALEGTAGPDALVLQFAGERLRVWLNTPSAEPPTYTLPRVFFSSLSINGDGGGDSLQLLGDAALPMVYSPDAAAPGSGVVSAADVAVHFASIESLAADTFSSSTAITPSANDTLTLDGNTLHGTSGDNPITPLTLMNVPTLTLDTAMHDDAPVGGISNAAASVDTISVAAESAIRLRLLPGQGSNALTLGDNARASLAPGATIPLRLTSLSIPATARLDVSDNEVLVTSASLAVIQGYVSDGRIFTSPATALTTLAPVPLETGGVRLKHALFGDADLDGRVGISDFFAADRGRALRLTGWPNGDFNHSGGVADGEDYMLLDRTFLAQ